jgi:hypothetical protein
MLSFMMMIRSRRQTEGSYSHQFAEGVLENKRAVE